MFQYEFVADQDCDRDHLGSVVTLEIRMSFSGGYRFKYNNVFRTLLW